LGPLRALRPFPTRRSSDLACEASCMIIFIVLAAHIFGYFFTLTRITNELVDYVGALETSRWVILALVVVGYLILGFFMDQIAILDRKSTRLNSSHVKISYA